MASDKEIAMAFNLKNRHLLSLVHHSEREINYLLDLSRDLQEQSSNNLRVKILHLFLKKPQLVLVVLLKWLLMIKVLE